MTSANTAGAETIPRGPYAARVSTPVSQQRDILRLAVPAFLALVAEPLFLLADAAIVGRLGVAQLAGLGVASAVLAHLGEHLRLPRLRHHGRRRPPARRRLRAPGRSRAGVDGTWLAIALGAPRQRSSPSSPRRSARRLRRLAGRPSAQAVTYLRVSAAGIPAMLVVLATPACCVACRTPGRRSSPRSAASASTSRSTSVRLRPAWASPAPRWGTVIAQTGWPPRSSWCSPGTPLARVPLRPHPGRVLAAARGGVPLLVRTLALRAVLARDHVGGRRARRRAGGRLPGVGDDLDLPRVRPRRPRHRRRRP